MGARLRLRPQSRWLARKIAREHGLPLVEAERGLLEQIARGCLRVIPGIGPEGVDAFDPINKEASDGSATYPAAGER